MNNRLRYKTGHVDEATSTECYKLPKFLFEGEFRALNSNARMAYSVMLDRQDSSIRNNWVDENDYLYIYFSREELANVLGLSCNTVIKTMKMLKQFHLVEEVRIGLGNPNRIYLLATENYIDSQMMYPDKILLYKCLVARIYDKRKN